MSMCCNRLLDGLFHISEDADGLFNIGADADFETLLTRCGCPAGRLAIGRVALPIASRLNYAREHETRVGNDSNSKTGADN